MVPLDVLWETCTSKGFLTPKHETSKRGRSGLVEAILGKNLDKRDLVSWAYDIIHLSG